MKRFKSNKLSIAGLALVLFIIFISIFAENLAPYPEDARLACHFKENLLPPSLEHPFGTDSAGRDVLSRVIFGGRTALCIGLAVQLITASIGVSVGTIAGYSRGWVLSSLPMRVSDVFQTIPTLALAMVAASTFEPSFGVIVMAMSLAWWPWYAKLIRSKVLSVREELFVEASEAMGKSKLRVIKEDIFPSIVSILVVKITMDMGRIVILAAALSFLGLGTQPPYADWGLDISTGRVFMPTFWWPSTFPGLFILIIVMGFSLLGDGLRDLLDVKLTY